MSLTDSEKFIHLRGGLVVPATPYLLLLDLERRGVPIAIDGPDLLVGPSRYVTDADRAAIRRWKPHLHQIVRYCLDPHTDAHLFTDTRRNQSAEATR